MSRRDLMGSFCAVTAAIVIAAGAAAAQADPAIADAKRILDLWRGAKADAVAAEFNAKMAAAVTADQMSKLWAAVEQQVGAYQKVVDERTMTPEPGMTAVILGLQFEKAVANYMVVFDAEKKIAGLSIRPRPPQ
jgi:hypothetical protein